MPTVCYKFLAGIYTWVRNRLRYCIWKHWKKPNKRMRSFIRLGIPKGRAYAWSRSRMGGWAIAQSPMMRTTVTLKRLIRRGYLSFSEQFQKSRRSVSNETQLVISFIWRTAVYETRTYSGVKGALAIIWSSATYSITNCFSFVSNTVRQIKLEGRK